jgi:hypothetical protein
MLPRIIALCGAARSGKDTVAGLLARDGYVNRKISARLKASVKVLFDFSEAQMEGAAKDEPDARWGISPRRALQFFGTEVMQFKAQEVLRGAPANRCFLVDAFVEEHLTGAPADRRIVVSDLRFAHDLQALRRRHDVFAIRVVRLGQRCSAAEHPPHASETESERIDVDAVLVNDGDDVCELARRVRAMVDRLRGPLARPSWR